MEKTIKKNAAVYLYIYFLWLVGMVFPAQSWAARIYLTPAQGEYRPGDTIVSEVRLETSGECINAVEAEISYPSAKLSVSDVSMGESILTLWPVPPKFDEESGKIFFTGGLPGGYCGRIPGDPGLSNILAKIVFRVPGFRIGIGSGPGQAEVEFGENTRGVIADGLGTLARLEKEKAVWSITDERSANANPWLDQLKTDNTPPEILGVEMVKMEKGVKYLIFSAQDKDSGLDRFEIMESDKSGKVAGTKIAAVWKGAASPYKLDDQNLHSVIAVKAIDKSGNEKIFEFIPPGYAEVAPKKGFSLMTIIAICVFAAALLSLIVLAVFKFKKKTARGNDA